VFVGGGPLKEPAKGGADGPIEKFLRTASSRVHTKLGDGACSKTSSLREAISHKNSEVLALNGSCNDLYDSRQLVVSRVPKRLDSFGGSTEALGLAAGGGFPALGSPRTWTCTM
jgi:hypothetical protein